MPKPSQKKYSEIFEKLSPELLKLAVSEETPTRISEICIGIGIEEEEKIEEIAYQIGRVLLGKLPPGDLQKIFETELTLDPLVAKKISEEINLNIFSPIKDSLAKVYGEITFPPTKPEVVPEKGEKPPTPPREDVYREPIE